MTLALHYALRSDVGLLREGNEDSAYAGPQLLAIADGMGGHAAGEVASAVAISAIAPLDRQGLTRSDDMLDALAAAVAAARNTLHDMSVADPAVEGMGTTLTALLWAGAQVAVCHIGDSRAYLLRTGDLYQITRDHTLIQSLVDEGRLSPAAAANHPQRSLIIRALQGSTDADPDLAMHDALLGDRYLLCSDGLTDVVSDEAVHHVLSTVADADQAVDQLIELAIRNGGPDNITCIVADVVDASSGLEVPTTDIRMAGAAAGGDISSLLRAATSEVPVIDPGTEAGHGGPSMNGHRSRAAAAVADEDDDEFSEPKRRWPVVTSVLVILVLVIAGGLYAGYRAIQGNYYLAADGAHVSIYRGVSQKIAFVSLSSVYQKTSVLVSEVPGDLVDLPTTPTTLAKTKATLTQIVQYNDCKAASASIAHWQAEYAAKRRSAEEKAAKSKTKNKKSKPPAVKVSMPTPEPKLPSFCPSGAG
ncbi:MAG TPA: protein phosphatase 2C domain-containing protein [Streptosporangiaceae bacterium]|nr:protein phosphatase 2C domain-containing protein [Streptosporangiaceae bacterium]